MLTRTPRAAIHRSDTRRLGRDVAAALVTASLRAACGSDDEDSAEPAASDEGEHAILSDAAVARGFAEMLALMTMLTADPSTADEAALEKVHELWDGVEGTVKHNDAGAHLQSEEALDAFLEGGADADVAAMTAATDKLSTTSTTFLAAHPG